MYAHSRQTSVLILFLIMVFGSVQAGGSAAAARQEEQAALIGFQDCTVAEAIAQLSAETGVRIEISGPIKRRIGQRVYRNRAVEEILLDLLRSENCAVVWHFRGARLAAAVVFLAGDAIAMAFGAVDDPHGTGLGTNAASSSDTADDQQTEAAGFESRERPAGLETAPAVDDTFRSAVLKKPAKQSGPILAAAPGRLVAGGRAPSAQAQAADNETDEPEHQAEPVGGTNGPPAPAAYGGLEPPPMPPAF